MLEVFDKDGNKKNIVEELDTLNNILKCEFVDVSKYGGDIFNQMNSFLKDKINIGCQNYSHYVFIFITSETTYIASGFFMKYLNGYASFIVHTYSSDNVFHIGIANGVPFYKAL